MTAEHLLRDLLKRFPGELVNVDVSDHDYGVGLCLLAPDGPVFFAVMGDEIRHVPPVTPAPGNPRAGEGVLYFPPEYDPRTPFLATIVEVAPAGVTIQWRPNYPPDLRTELVPGVPFAGPNERGCWCRIGGTNA